MCQVHVVQQGQEPDDFWIYLGGEGAVSKSHYVGEAATQLELPSPRKEAPPPCLDTISVGIIGGGLAGAAAAAFLAKHPWFDVTVFERAPHVGGRLGSDRLDPEHHVDYGAPTLSDGCPYIATRHPRFRDQMEEWLKRGVVQAWRPFAGMMDRKGTFTPFGPGDPVPDLPFCALCKEEVYAAPEPLPCCDRVLCDGCASKVWGRAEVRDTERKCPVCGQFFNAGDTGDGERAKKREKEQASEADVQTFGASAWNTTGQHWRISHSQTASQGHGANLNWFIGTTHRGLPGVCLDLLDHPVITVETNAWVRAFGREEGDGKYYVRYRDMATREGQAGRSGTHHKRFDFILLCLPPKPCARLLKHNCPPMARFCKQLRPQAIWVVNVSFCFFLSTTFDAAFVERVPELCFVTREGDRVRRSYDQNHGPRGELVERHADQHDTWALHASARWSEEHINDTPASVANAVLDAFLKLLKLDRLTAPLAAAPEQKAVRRGKDGCTAPNRIDPLGTYIDATMLSATLWPQAIGRTKNDLLHLRPGGDEPPSDLVKSWGLNDSSLLDSGLQIGVAGDWCVETTAEGAYLSGCHLATRVVERVNPSLDRGVLHRVNDSKEHAKHLKWETQLLQRRKDRLELQVKRERVCGDVLKFWERYAAVAQYPDSVFWVADKLRYRLTLRRCFRGWRSDCHFIRTTGLKRLAMGIWRRQIESAGRPQPGRPLATYMLEKPVYIVEEPTAAQLAQGVRALADWAMEDCREMAVDVSEIDAARPVGVVTVAHSVESSEEDPVSPLPNRRATEMGGIRLVCLDGDTNRVLNVAMNAPWMSVQEELSIMFKRPVTIAYGLSGRHSRRVGIGRQTPKDLAIENDSQWAELVSLVGLKTRPNTQPTAHVTVVDLKGSDSPTPGPGPISLPTSARSLSARSLPTSQLYEDDGPLSPVSPLASPHLRHVVSGAKRWHRAKVKAQAVVRFSAIRHNPS